MYVTQGLQTPPVFLLYLLHVTTGNPVSYSKITEPLIIWTQPHVTVGLIKHRQDKDESCVFDLRAPIALDPEIIWPLRPLKRQTQKNHFLNSEHQDVKLLAQSCFWVQTLSDRQRQTSNWPSLRSPWNTLIPFLLPRCWSLWLFIDPQNRLHMFHSTAGPEEKNHRDVDSSLILLKPVDCNISRTSDFKVAVINIFIITAYKWQCSGVCLLPLGLTKSVWAACLSVNVHRPSTRSILHLMGPCRTPVQFLSHSPLLHLSL